MFCDVGYFVCDIEKSTTLVSGRFFAVWWLVRVFLAN